VGETTSVVHYDVGANKIKQRLLLDSHWQHLFLVQALHWQQERDKHVNRSLRCCFLQMRRFTGDKRRI